MPFRFSDIIPKEHGAWPILLVPFFSGAFLRGKPGFSVLLLFICIISLYLLRGCGEFYLSNRIKETKNYKNIYYFYFLIVFISFLFIAASTLLLFYFKYRNLLLLGAIAFFLIVFYYFVVFSKQKRKIYQELIVIMALTLNAPAAYYVTNRIWDNNVLLLWILNYIFFQLGLLYVHNKIGLHKKRIQTGSYWEKLLFSKNLAAGWCFSFLVLYVLSLAGYISYLLFIIFLPITIHIIGGVFFGKGGLNIKRMGYFQVGQDIFFLINLVCFFRTYGAFF